MLAVPALVRSFIRTRPKTYAVAGCFFCASAYVGLLYVWRRGSRRVPLPRNHPTMIKQRMISVAAACCVAWLPLYLALPNVRDFLELMIQAAFLLG